MYYRYASVPDEVAAIVGLDMATPITYLEWGRGELDKRIAGMRKLRKLRDLGLLFWYPLNRRGLDHCYQCGEDCRKGLLSKSKPYGFTLFLKRYGLEALLDCLERNERAGVVYHREGITGDYDDFEDAEELIRFLRTGKR